MMIQVLTQDPALFSSRPHLEHPWLRFARPWNRRAWCRNAAARIDAQSTSRAPGTCIRIKRSGHRESSSQALKSLKLMLRTPEN